MDPMQRIMELPAVARMVCANQQSVEKSCLLLSMFAMITTMSITILKNQSTSILQTSMVAMITAMAIATAKSQATSWLQTSILAMIMAIAKTSKVNDTKTHDCHGHEHSHCEEPISLHSVGEHACHDHEQGHEHHCCDEQKTPHTADVHSGHDHGHDNLEVEEIKDCDAELPRHHSHCCHEPHDQAKNATDSVQEHSISVDEPSDHHQHHQHNEEHKEENCGHHLKAKDCTPPPTDCSSRNCCSTTSTKGCGSKGKEICSSLQEDRTKQTSRCCRSYVKCSSRPRSCCSYNVVKLPEIVVE
uniref:Uncharacterized protein n=1 Tax=Leersia perrieri TaxID=77586 RepID=A0A0D9V8V8_9ORYZ